MLFNVREKIRTPDTLVRSQVLYPAELRALVKDISLTTLYIIQPLFHLVNHNFKNFKI